MLTANAWKSLGKCVVAGFAIEIPMLAWFLSVQDRMHVSMVPGVLFIFQLPGYFLMFVLMWPFKAHVSTATYNWVGELLLCCVQAVMIGGVLFLARLKKHFDTRRWS